MGRSAGTRRVWTIIRNLGGIALVVVCLLAALTGGTGLALATGLISALFFGYGLVQPHLERALTRVGPGAVSVKLIECEGVELPAFVFPYSRGKDVAASLGCLVFAAMGALFLLAPHAFRGPPGTNALMGLLTVAVAVPVGLWILFGNGRALSHLAYTREGIAHRRSGESFFVPWTLVREVGLFEFRVADHRADMLGVRLAEDDTLKAAWTTRPASWKWLGGAARGPGGWDIQLSADQLIAPAAIAATIGRHFLTHPADRDRIGRPGSEALLAQLMAEGEGAPTA